VEILFRRKDYQRRVFSYSEVFCELALNSFVIFEKFCVRIRFELEYEFLPLIKVYSEGYSKLKQVYLPEHHPLKSSVVCTNELVIT